MAEFQGSERAASCRRQRSEAAGRVEDPVNVSSTLSQSCGGATSRGQQQPRGKSKKILIRPFINKADLMVQ